MKKNFMDIVTDELKADIEAIVAEAREEFGGANPYRKERIPDEERIDDFAQLTDADIEFGQQHFPAEVDNYLKDMDDLMRRRNARTTMESL